MGVDFDWDQDSTGTPKFSKSFAERSRPGSRFPDRMSDKCVLLIPRDSARRPCSPRSKSPIASFSKTRPRLDSLMRPIVQASADVRKCEHSNGVESPSKERHLWIVPDGGAKKAVSKRRQAQLDEDVADARDRLRQALERYQEMTGASQADICRATGFSRTAVSDHLGKKRGKELPLATVIRYCRGLGINPGWVVMGEEPKFRIGALDQAVGQSEG